jgi:predicted AlkP superfamily pyrophosphatase or phosphodiesterase
MKRYRMFISRSHGCFVIVAVVVHVILCYSVIDIHFQSPIIPGVQPVPPNTVAPARRLVFIVADGVIYDLAPL